MTIPLLIALPLIFSLMLTPPVRTLALRWGFIDKPDKRKVHQKPIPRVGGVAVVIAYFAAFLLFVVPMGQGAVASGGIAAIKSIAPAVLIIFLIGLADDIFSLEPWHKFSVQAIAALLVVLAGVRFHDIADLPVHPVVGGVVTVLWLVACTNAINLIDGLDGLASGVSLLASLTILIASVLSGHVALAILTAPLVGALAGFLFFNSNPASIFLGDSGSLVLGFLLGCFGVLWSEKATSVLDGAAPLLTLAIPLLDTSISILRRFLSRRPVFRPDQAHIHHKLLARGCSHRRAVLWLYLATAIAGVFSLSLIWAQNQWKGVVLVLFAAATTYGIHQLRYSEFAAARNVLGADLVRREIGARLAVQELERGLTEAETPNECWSVIQLACHHFGLHAIQMQLRSEKFISSNKEPMPGEWAIRIVIAEGSWVELFHGASTVGYPAGLVPFAETVRRILTNKSVEQPVVPVPQPVYQANTFGVISSAFTLQMQEETKRPSNGPDLAFRN
jgi:UDP-GlcNAc:undecaprenyl-phosphate GlcNAc-1-phosphate transferase